MKFNTVLCNPPYNNEHNRPIYQDFLTAFDSRCDSSCWIIPRSWVGNPNWSVSRQTREALLKLGVHTVVENQPGTFSRASVRTTTMVCNKPLSSKNITLQERHSGKSVKIEERTLSSEKILLVYDEEELQLIKKLKAFSSGKLYQFKNNGNPYSWKIGCFDLVRHPEKSAMSEIRLIDPNEFSMENIHKYFNLWEGSEEDSLSVHEKAKSFWHSKLVQFLLHKTTHTYTITPSWFEWVPKPDYTKLWTDEEIYAKYGLTEREVELVEQFKFVEIPKSA